MERKKKQPASDTRGPPLDQAPCDNVRPSTDPSPPRSKPLITTHTPSLFSLYIFYNDKKPFPIISWVLVHIYTKSEKY